MFVTLSQKPLATSCKIRLRVRVVPVELKLFYDLYFCWCVGYRCLLLQVIIISSSSSSSSHANFIFIIYLDIAPPKQPFCQFDLFAPVLLNLVTTFQDKHASAFLCLWLVLFLQVLLFKCLHSSTVYSLVIVVICLKIGN